ncbi:MAG: carbon-nitrogen hydrolase family protein [Rhodobacteraceae bacterium]|nr:carbon-nitrogen hydrolase family protein [Paracoccaceae bacterium]
MSEGLHVAVAQCPADLMGGQARLEWLDKVLADHEGAMPDLVILPELFQCGYNIGDRISELAEGKAGVFSASVAALARAYGAAILYGYAERQGIRIFNAAQCIDKRGAVVGHHRKLVLPPGFEGDHFTPGRECQLFRFGEITIAILVCYDVEFPESLRHVALQGAELVIVPTALGAQWGVVSERLVPTRAFENGVFLCYANYCGTESGLNYYGGSCIVAPDGSDLARAGRGPALLDAHLNKAAVKEAQDRLPYLRDRLALPWI